LFNVNKVHYTLSESEYSRLLSNDDLWFLKLVIKTILRILLKLLLSTGATLCGQASATLWLVWATLKFEPR